LFLIKKTKMKIISFIEIKKFIIEKLSEFSIDEFYFEKNKYFIYSKENQPKINDIELLDAINEKFDILYFWLDEKFIDRFFPLLKNNSYHQNKIVTSEEEKKRNNERESLLKYSHKYYTANELINEIIKNENIKLSENEILELTKNKISNFKIWILNNLENIKNYENLKSKKVFENEKSIENLINELNDKENEISIIVKNLSDLNITIENIQKYINNFAETESQNIKKIDEIDDVINKLSPHRDKEPYIKQIKELEKEKINIPLEFNSYKTQILQKDEDCKKQLENLNKLKYELECSKFEIENKIEIKKVENEKLINEINPFDYDIELKAINSFFNYKDNYHNNYQNEFSNNLFFEVYQKYELINNFEWKSELIKCLNEKIPNPITFRIFEEKDFEKPKIAQISNDFLTERISGRNKDIVNLLNRTIEDLYPIWNSLKVALITNEISIDINNCFFVSLNNGIYAKIIVRKGKITKKNTVAFKYRNNSFTKDCEIFSGYTNSGFILPNGIYLNYRDLYFEIDFFANSLLLNNFNYNQQIQSISDKAKGDYEEEQRRLEEEYYYDD